MYYVVAALLRPFALTFIVVAAGLVASWRRWGGRRSLFVLTAAVILLTLLTLPVTSYLALGSLEWRYPPLEERPAGAAAVVVLSGSLRPDDGDEWRSAPGTDTLYRCLRAAEIYRAAACPVIVSGGKVHAVDPAPPPADVMRDFLLTQGVRSEDLIVEDTSRTTHENAVETARLLSARGIRRIVLVTDAAHLRRAVGCFRKQGIDVVPCGCRYRAMGRNGGLIDFLPDASAAVGVEDAAHEWLGIVWYWLTDRI
jgi:uncharacterized SAM-binding protein YcdF (DUF218 family)